MLCFSHLLCMKLHHLCFILRFLYRCFDHAAQYSPLLSLQFQIMVLNAWSIFALNPAIIEVDLQVKGATESEDEHLSFLVAPARCYDTMFSHLFNRELTLAILAHWSLNLATLLTPWRPQYLCESFMGHGQIVTARSLFAAFTTGFTDRCPMPVGNKLSTGTGGFTYSCTLAWFWRRETACCWWWQDQAFMACCFCWMHWGGDSSGQGIRRCVEVVGKRIRFHALEDGRSISEIDIGFCKVEATVLWSLVSCYPWQQQWF